MSFNETELSFLKQYVGYLKNGCPPPSKYQMALVEVADWQERGMRESENLKRSLLKLLEYATSEDMAWELQTVSGQGPEFANKFSAKLRDQQ